MHVIVAVIPPSHVLDEVEATLARIPMRGVWALEDEGDLTVALPLVGDVPRLDQLARSLPTLVARHGFFVDRRRWAPRLTLGSVTATTSLPFLERLVHGLAGHTSQTWVVDSVALARRRFDGSPEAWEVIETVRTSTARS